MRKKNDSLHSRMGTFFIQCHVCKHTYMQIHTHTFIFDSHIDHRTCHKMSKSDYLINVYSTRRWPSYEFIYFFLICCVLVLHTLDIRHQFKYVFMLYGQYKKKREISTIRPTHTHIGGAWSVAACVCVFVCVRICCAQRRFIVCVLVCLLYLI